MSLSLNVTCPPAPTLHCPPHSPCQPGLAHYDPIHSQAFPNLQTHESGYHCVCPPTAIGHECQIPVRQCNGYVCYHGGTCQNGKCDCSSANRVGVKKYAGRQCEMEATSYCAVTLLETWAPKGQFCTNYGTCKRLVTMDSDHPGCVCREGWVGDRCEIRKSVFEAMEAAKARAQQVPVTNAAAGKMLVGLIAIAGIAVVGVLTVVLMKRRKRSRKEVGEVDADGSETMAKVGTTLDDLDLKENTEDTTPTDDTLTSDQDRSEGNVPIEKELV